jgi:hypothetical protein
MMVSSAGIHDAAMAYAVVNGIMVFMVIAAIVGCLYQFGVVVRIIKEEADPSKATYRLGGLVVIYMAILTPALLWFLWNFIMALMAPEFYVLSRLP